MPAKTNRLYPRQALMEMDLRAFSGETLKQISMPLGGIGTGCIGLGGRGELRDWEIFNSSNVGNLPDYCIPFLHCRWGGKKINRVLERRLLPPHTSPSGLPTAQVSGLPRLAEAVFYGTFPFGRVQFLDDELPLEIMLEAFNPLIPANPEDSGLPVAILTYRLKNRTRQRVSGTIAWNMLNSVGMSAVKGERPDEPQGLGQNVNTYCVEKSCRGVAMTSQKYTEKQLGYGSMALMTPHARTTVATGWLEPGWWDRAQKIWDDFADDGKLEGPTTPTPPSADGQSTVATLGVLYDLKPGESTQITFVIAWSFPNHGIPTCHDMQIDAGVRNHYAARFPDAWSAGRYAIENLPRLHRESRAFEQALFDTELPGDVIEAVSSQMSILKSNTVMWLDTPANEPFGRIMAFEGCGDKGGCCPMNCTHVWNYEQTMAHLFPQLERTMRLTDFDENVVDNGRMRFRTMLPIAGQPAPKQWEVKFPAADGQFGTVVKLYRDWQLSGDTQLIKNLFPKVRECIDYTQRPDTKWDADGDGVIEGVQHNTYDIDFHGPNTMVGSLYIAALKAGVEMAIATGDTDAAKRWEKLSAKAQRGYDKLFQGGYYIQKIANVEAGAKDNLNQVIGDATKPTRPKYQYGFGCLADQLLGQWMAHVAGLGYILPQGHVRQAMKSIFEHNFRTSLLDHESIQRTYAVNDEAGLLICTWPNGKREKFPFPYSDEIWTGIEYQVAAHLIYEGMIEEGLTIVRAIRERHDGLKRNPFDEPECGHYYARAMASWSVLLALTGQRYSGVTQKFSIDPKLNAKDFNSFVTLAEGWGSWRQKLSGKKFEARLALLGGESAIKTLEIGWPTGKPAAKLSAVVKTNGKAIPSALSRQGNLLVIELDEPLTIRSGETLYLQVK